MTVGERIREARKYRQMTQRELGELCGIAEPTIRRYELGMLNPKFETIRKIASALDFDPGWLVYEEHDLLSIDLQRVFLGKIHNQIEDLLALVDPADFYEIFGTYDFEAPFSDLWDARKPLTKARLEEVANELGTSFEYLVGFSDDPDGVGEKQQGGQNGEQ